MMVTTAIFLMASVALFHTYALYPFVLRLLRTRRREPVTPNGRLDITHNASHTWPTISVIIPFHNEDQWVARKLENTLSWDYPTDRLEIIAVSDGSTDQTNATLESYAGRVRVVSYHPRWGKPTALNRGAELAHGEIFVFTDANVLLQPKAIRAMIAQYEDRTIGGVSGRIALRAEGTDEPLGEGLYMRYEQSLYHLESATGTMVGADGAFFSIRRELFIQLPPDTIADDLAIALQVIARGRRVVYEAEAHGAELVIPNVRAEFCRKVRMIVGGYQALWRFRHLLNPLRFPLVSFQLVSHKLLRWWTPFFLGTVFVSAAINADNALFAVALAVQCAFYGLAILGWGSAKLRRWGGVYLPYYFCATNLAAVQGLWRFLYGRQAITWEKVGR